MTLQHVLVATDFSEKAREALLRVALIARGEMVQRLSAVHVLEPDLVAALERLTGREDGRDIRGSAEAQLREAASELQMRAGIDVELRLLEGDRRSCLVEEAKCAGSDLIVVGGQGTSGVRRFLLGSTSEWLAGAATIAALLVKGAARSPYRRVLLPVDLTTSPASAVALARHLAPGAAMVLLHCYEVPFEGHLRYASVEETQIRYYRERAHADASAALVDLKARLAEPGEVWDSVAMHGTPAETILDAERSLKPDLVVMPRHAAGRVERWLLGSVTRKVIEQCHADIAILPPP